MVKFDIENKIKVLEEQIQDDQTVLNLLESYYELITLVSNKDFNYSKIICKKAIRLSKKVQHAEFTLKFEKELGIIHTYIGDFDKAKKCFNNALEQVKQTNNIEAQIGLLLNIGLVCINIKQEDEGYKELYKAAELANNNLDKVSSRLVISIYINLGNVHNDLGLYESALEYFVKALEIINKKDGNYLYNKGRIFWYIGVNYNYQKNFELSEKNLKKSLSILSEINVENEIFHNYTAFSSLYRDFNHFESSLKFAIKAIDLAAKLQSPRYEYLASKTLIEILLLFLPDNDSFKELSCKLTYEQLLNKIEKIVLSNKNATLILDVYKIKSNYHKTNKHFKASLKYKEKIIESLENKYEEEK